VQVNIRLEHLYADLNASMSSLREQHDAVTQSRKIVDKALLDGQAHYGINTGFGVLANKRISTDELTTLQQNIATEHPVEPCLWRRRAHSAGHYPTDAAT